VRLKNIFEKITLQKKNSAEAVLNVIKIPLMQFCSKIIDLQFCTSTFKKISSSIADNLQQSWSKIASSLIAHTKFGY
jgi:hypothetical protein